MSYINIESVMPKELVQEIQKYVEGAYIYIPKQATNKKAWGEGTNTRQELAQRNRSIYDGYESGKSVRALALEYYLSEKSIQRIILQLKRVYKKSIS